MSYNGVSQSLQTSAFGELSVAQLTPRIQLQFPYTINTDITTSSLTGNGTVTHSAPFAVCSTTAQANSGARLTSNNSLHYRTGQGGACFFTAIYTTGVANSTQLVGLGNSENGFFFGYNGSSFGINRRSNSADNWIPQTTWNKDKMDGSGSSGMTLDPTKGNVYKIQYQWLGFGAINFFIESQYTGAFTLVHSISYANQNTQTSVINPSMPVFLEALNTSNSTNIVVKVASIAAFVEGLLADVGIINAINNAKSGVTTELNLLTIKVKPTFNGVSNKKFVAPSLLSFTTTGNPDCTYKLKLNAALGGSPSYTDISSSTSVVSYDTAGTTVTGGRLLSTFFVNGNNETTVNIKDLGISLNPSDTLTISATSSGAAIAPACSITWTEQF